MIKVNRTNKTPEYYANLFKKNMDTVIKFWEQEQHRFFDNLKNVGPSNEITSRLVNRIVELGYDKFPHNFYLLWFNKYKDGQFTLLSEEDILKEVNSILSNNHTGHFTQMDYGDAFEILGKQLLEHKDTYIQEVANELGLSLEYTGDKHGREDFSLNKEFSLDFKFTLKDLADDSRFKNIIKTKGASRITDIHGIEDSIVRSLYKYGYNDAMYRGGSGATQHKGIYFLPNMENEKNLQPFKEIDPTETQLGKKQWANAFNKKELIFIYPEDGYWASYCIKEVVNWAAGRIIELGFKTRDIGGQSSITANEFWKFSYGKLNK